MTDFSVDDAVELISDGTALVLYVVTYVIGIFAVAGTSGLIAAMHLIFSFAGFIIIPLAGTFTAFLFAILIWRFFNQHPLLDLDEEKPEDGMKPIQVAVLVAVLFLVVSAPFLTKMTVIVLLEELGQAAYREFYFKKKIQELANETPEEEL